MKAKVISDSNTTSVCGSMTESAWINRRTLVVLNKKGPVSVYEPGFKIMKSR